MASLTVKPVQKVITPTLVVQMLSSRELADKIPAFTPLYEQAGAVRQALEAAAKKAGPGCSACRLRRLYAQTYGQIYKGFIDIFQRLWQSNRDDLRPLLGILRATVIWVFADKATRYKLE